MHTNMYSIKENDVENFLDWLDSLSDVRFVNVFKQEINGVFNCFVNNSICRKDFSQLAVSSLKAPQRVVLVNNDNPKSLDFINLGKSDIVIMYGDVDGKVCSHIIIDHKLYELPNTFNLYRK